MVVLSIIYKMENLSDCLENKKSVSQNDFSLSTQQKLDLSSWGLPEGVLQFYESKGISQMFPWQLECLTIGKVLDGGNLIYSAPTSAGKTLVAEILISQTVLEKQKKVLVILPFVSLVREKMFYFKNMFSTTGVHVEGYMGSHSPSITFQRVSIAVCTIEKANSMINKMMEEKTLHKIGLVVVDELHLLGDSYRGYLLELLLTKLKYMSLSSESEIQVVGMSATLPNLKMIADWLNADIYFSNFRPIPLSERLKCGQTVFDKKLNKLFDIKPPPSEVVDDSENVGFLCLDTIQNGHSVLIFCPTKVWCENLADKIATYFRRHGCSKSATVENSPGWILRKELNLQKINEVIEHLRACPVGLDKDLHKTVAYGVGFHHAGLTLDERDIIEGSFRQGTLRVLCATSTLSSGVNLPARRVIIRSPMSFGGLMDILTYRQMIGRAGRMGVDSEGESILICKPNEKNLSQLLMTSNLKPIESCLGHGHLSASLKRALLEVVASGVVSTPEEIKKYTDCTFLAFSSKFDIEDPIQSCIQFLIDNEFIRLQEEKNRYLPTPLGQACLASSLPPDEGLSLFRELERARRCFVLDSDLHLIYQVTPYSVSEQWSKLDWVRVMNILGELPAHMKRVGDLVGVQESFLIRVIKGSVNINAPENRSKLSILRRFYTSLALQDLINEVPLNEVARKFVCNKGLLQSLQQSAATYAGMVTEFTKRLGWGSVELIISQFQERLQFGIQRELSELMRLSQLNGGRARALYNSGFTSLASIANAEITDLESALHEAAPFQTRKVIAGETSFEREERNKLQKLWVTGKADITVRQAAEMLITEARILLELELGLNCVQWNNKAHDGSSINSPKFSQISFSVDRLNTKKERKANEEVYNVNMSRSKVVKSPLRVISTPLKSDYGNSVAIEVNKSKFHHSLTKGYVCESDEGGEEKGDGDNEEDEEGDSDDDDDVNIISSTMQINLGNTFKESCTIVRNENKMASSIGEETSQMKTDNNQIISFKETKSEIRNLKELSNKFNETDYFAQSLNLEGLLDSETLNHVNVLNKSLSPKSDKSDSSIEIIYHKTSHSTNIEYDLSRKRYSEDMFDISPSDQKISTPNLSFNNVISKGGLKDCDKFLENMSPDLFSQSLTFDTQLQRVLDFDEPLAEENDFLEAKPSTSLNSDDLGFVSDLSPPKLGRKSNMIAKHSKPLPSTSRLITESFFADEPTLTSEGTKRKKRKHLGNNSPDLVLRSDDTFVPETPASKRSKITTCILKPSFLDDHLTLEESDDEIMPTPKQERSLLSKLSWKSKSLNNQKPSNDISKAHTLKEKNNQTECINDYSEERKNVVDQMQSMCSLKTSCRLSSFKKSKTNLLPVTNEWNEVNIVNVTGNKKVFEVKKENFECHSQSFCEELKNQNIVGLALGCRRKEEENKSTIGSKILRRKSLEPKSNFYCEFGETILDGIAFYWKGIDIFYVSMDEGSVSLSEKIDFLKSVKHKILRILDSRAQMKFLKHCTSVLLKASYEDPKIASWLIAQTWKETNISALVLEHFPEAAKLTSLLGPLTGVSSPGLLSSSPVPPKLRAGVESLLSFHLMERQQKLLKNVGLLEVFQVTEMPLALCLAEMELTGLMFNRDKLLEIRKQLENSRSLLELKACSLAGYTFSLSSPAAVSKVLYNELDLGGSKKLLTKKKKASTSKEALLELITLTNHPLPEVILQWRKIGNVITKVLCPLLQAPRKSDRIFAVSQTFTATGRISMHEPNLQNIPRDFEVLRDNESHITVKVRDIFIAPKSCVLLAADYCQIELRILTHLSEDSNLIRSITSEPDVFINIASDIYNIPHEKVSDEIRQKAKQTCYGMIYGIGAKALSRQLRVEEGDALNLIEDFKNKYRRVGKFLENTVSDCRKNGYVVTLLGRRRYLPAINDSNPAIRCEAERQAVNTTIQGSAADLAKVAMIQIRNKIDQCELSAKLVLHLHDELLFEVNERDVSNVAMILKQTMENAYLLNIPTPVKVRTGPTWGQLEVFRM